MSTKMYECKICGWKGLQWPHQGSVDCVNQYRLLVEELRGLLPKGKEVMRAPIERDTTVRLWIDGEITFDGLERLVTYIRFMQEAWTKDENAERPKTLGDSDLSVVRLPTEDSIAS